MSVAGNSGETAATPKKQRGRPFPKGMSGNPAGRPKLPQHVRDACRALTDQAIGTLKAVMADKRAPAAARVSASNSILDRGWGKPESSTDVRLGGLPGAPPVGTAQVDLSHLTSQQVYDFVLNGAPLPDAALPKPSVSNGDSDGA